MTFTPRAAILSCAAVATLCGMALAFAQASSKQTATAAPPRKTATPKQAPASEASAAAAPAAPAAASRVDAKPAAAPPADTKTDAPASVDTKTAAAAPPDAKTAVAAPVNATAPKAGTAPPPDPKAATDSLVEPSGFTYSIEGRRDPFISLLRRGGEITASAGGTRPSGLGGLVVGEITLRGTMRSREGFVAILQGADQKAYIVRAGDRLADGTVRTISQNDMVIVQQVDDPLSLEKQREVRKVLRQIEAN